MERRDRAVINDYHRLLDKVMYADGTQARIDARLQAAREHAALVEQRDRLADAAKEALNWITESFLDQEDQPTGVVGQLRDALATVEQGEGQGLPES